MSLLVAIFIGRREIMSSNKDDLTNKIIEIEEDMFSRVQNIGGKALCQEDLVTFKIMRSSQFISWSDAALESYLNDLTEAKKSGRNLLTEKYARMMKSTSPLEYARIKDLLPPLEPEVASLIDRIAEIELKWQEELLERFPYVVERGRPVYNSEDSPFATSMETYLRGELATYSKKTLELYYENCLDQKSKNISGAEITLEHMVKRYGYKSLEEANQKLRECS